MAETIRRHRVLLAAMVALMAGVLVSGFYLWPHPASALAPNASAAKAAPALIGLDPNLNENVKSVAEVRATGKHGERVSALITPAKFDKVAFARNPKAYLDVVEPGRVGDILQPGKDVKSIQIVGRADLKVARLGTVTLAVKVQPNAPVTFTSFDMGAFDNKLPSITVQADGTGQASVSFTATAGTTQSARIMVGCPLTAGVAHFFVIIAPAKPTAPSPSAKP